MEQQLKHGEVTLFCDHYSVAIPRMMDAAIKLQKKGDVAFIDCANRFDPYFVESVEKGNCKKVLEKISIARPFTLYQLREIITRKLEDFISKTGTKALIISSINAFDQKEIPRKELRAISRIVEKKIKKITKEHGLVTIVSRIHGDFHGNYYQ